MIISLPKRNISLYKELVNSGTNPKYAQSFVEQYGTKQLDPGIGDSSDDEIVTFSVPTINTVPNSVPEFKIDTSHLLILLALTGLIVLGIVALRKR